MSDPSAQPSDVDLADDATAQQEAVAEPTPEVVPGRSSEGTRVRGGNADDVSASAHEDESQDEDDESQDTDDESQDTDDESQDTDDESQDTDDESQDTDDESQDTDDEVKDADDGSEAEDGEDDDDPESTLEGEAEIAADYLEELLDIADLDGDIDTYIEGERAHVSIVSDSQVLVGDRGEVLDALQELTRLAVMTETGERSRLMLDVAGFRDRRRQQLVAQAAAAVERVRSTGQPVPFEPMNPFERKIVHDAVAAAGLSSESEGDEPRRHVVVQPQA